MKQHKFHFIIGTVLSLISLSAHADTIYTSQSAFDAAITGGTTYSIPAPGGGNTGVEVVSNPYTVGPLTFGGGYDIELYNDRFYGAGQTYLGDYAQTATVTLAGADALGFTLGSFDGPETVTITVNGDQVDVLSLDGQPSTSFFGITSDTPITSIDLSQSLVAFQPPSAEFDVLNFTVVPSATPEPATWLLMGTGLAFLAVTRRRVAHS